MRARLGRAQEREGEPRVTDLSAPQLVMARLEAIEQDLAARQAALEAAARAWFMAKRQREHDRAVAFLSADGATVAERNALADQATALDGREAEAEWEALRAVVRVLDTRATIGMGVLKAQGRA